MQPGVMSHEKWILKIRPGFLPKGTKLKEKALVKFHFSPFGKLEQNQIYPPTRSEHKLISLSPCALGSERSALKCWLLLPATRDSADRTVQHGRTEFHAWTEYERCVTFGLIIAPKRGRWEDTDCKSLGVREACCSTVVTKLGFFSLEHLLGLCFEYSRVMP